MSVRFVKTGAVKAMLLLRDLGEFIAVLFHVYYPKWVKFGITVLQVMLFSICEFSENPHREGRTFLMVINEITYTCLL
jgi:hypothetical protein